MVMAEPAARSSIRLAELLAVLSLATDLGMGQPMEHVLRQCLISLRLAQRLGLDEADRVVVYYAALIAWVGCHVDAYEQAKWFGDDMALKADFRRVDFASAAAGPMFMLGHLGAGRPVAERARLGVAFLGGGRRAAEEMLENHWLAADALAARLGLDQQVRDSVEQTFERWDGKGVPKGARGEEILLTSRLVTLADVVEVFQRAKGTDAAIAVARERRGTQFDPQVVDIFAAEAASMFAGLDEVSNWDAVISAEPALERWVADAELEAALEAIADFTDVKSPYTIGHSRAVADLAGEAARVFGLGDQAGKLVRRAGLVHVSAALACRTRSGTSKAHSATLSANASGFIRISPSACWRARPHERQWPLSPSSTMSDWTALAIRAARRAAPSVLRGGCWLPRTSTTHGPSRGPTGSQVRPARRPPSCVPRSGQAGWMARRWPPRCPPPGTGRPAGRLGRRRRPAVRSKSSDCWPGACRTRRSASISLSPARRPPITSSTSTRRQGPPTGRWPACSPPITG